MKTLLRAGALALALLSYAPAMASQDSAAQAAAARAQAAVDALAAQIAALGNGSSAPVALNIAVTSRDAQNRVSAYTSSGTAYAVTYDSFGPATIAGGGKTTTVTRDASGLVTSIATQ